MNRICFVNGSPRGNQSASKGLIEKVSEMLNKNTVEIHEICVIESLRNNIRENDFLLLENVTSIVFVFPLYIDAIPSNLLEYMYELEEYIASHPHGTDYHPPKVYAIINNGFIEGSQNINALKIMSHFTKTIGYNWRFGIGIGAGEFVKETMDVIPLKSRLKRNINNALIKLAGELESQGSDQYNNIVTNPSMPKLIFQAVGNRRWTLISKKSKKSLSKKVWS